MSLPIATIEIRHEHDVVLARQRARQIGELLGLDRQDQVRLATAVSEIARNAYQYAGGGKVEISLQDGQPQALMARISDRGRGIAALNEIMDGGYVSRTGMGVGLIGAKRLMDDFRVESGPEGTTVTLLKQLGSGAPPVKKSDLGKIAQQLAQFRGEDPFVEIQRQNQDLLAAMAQLQRQKEELAQLNRELEDTNRGVVALYAELDQRADFLRRVSESKTRFLSNITHEFRTPLNSIISLSRMLSDKLDGDLTPEQEKQVGFIRKAASELSGLVNDLLDLAKVESGKVAVKRERFELAAVFNSLRGTLRPLLAQNSQVNLVIEEPENVPSLCSDETKVAQILRNFISNALKFTERGEVRVSARRDGEWHVVIAVADTGIGIAPEDRERIFEEFEQVEGPQQLRHKGTGLGLPLAKSLAELLGGTVLLDSQLGLGSTFSLRLPISAAGGEDCFPKPELLGRMALIVDDDEAERYVMRSHLDGMFADFQEAAGGAHALRIARDHQPDLVVLDLGLPDMDGAEVLRRMSEDPGLRDIRVMINTARTLGAEERRSLERLAGAILFKPNVDPAAVREAAAKTMEHTAT